MGRARKQSTPAVSLFPFLSILVCVIGALTLMIAVELFSDLGLDVLDVTGYETAVDQVEGDTNEISRHHALIAEAEKVATQLAAAREALASLKAERDQRADASRLDATILASIQRLREEIAQLEERLSSLDRERDELRARLAELQAKDDKTIRLAGGGSGTDIVPFFVECTGEGIVLSDFGQNRRLVPTKKIKKDARYRSYLAKVRARSNGELILLVRPEGVHAYDAARARAKKTKTRVGKIALPGSGDIDFSMFTSS